MIPATHFLPLHDGTAWVVFGDDDNERDFFPAEWVTDLDRPCDTCDGGTFEIDKGFNGGVCPECAGSGRHTFDVEVECWNDGTEMVCPRGSTCSPTCGGWATYRVHVLDVLPIRQWASTLNPPLGRWLAMNGGSGRYSIQECDGIGLTSHPSNVTLPPAARPGMWAVKVRIA